MFKVNGCTLQIDKYPNGESLFGPIPWGDHLEWAYDGEHEIAQLAFLGSHLADRVHEPRLRIAYLPYSRMDRTPNGEVFALKYLANIINSIGFSSVEIVDPHSDVCLALIDRSHGTYIAPSLVSGPLYDYIVFPDAGAEKRYTDKRFSPTETLIGNKHRDFETGKIKSLRLLRADGVMMGNDSAKGQSAVIVDDLCSYGGTFIHCAKALHTMGIVDITLCVTHLENSVYEGQLLDHVDRVIAWDTLQSVSQHPLVTIKRRFR